MSVFCLFLGIGMMFSVRHLFPVFLDLMALNFMESDEDVYHVSEIPVNILKSEPESYPYYLPIVSSDRAKEESVRIDQPQAQILPEVESDDRAFGISFEDGSAPVTIVVAPLIEQNHAETPVEITFLPGENCIFGDGHACVYKFLSPAGNRIIFVSAHSGMGGEADGFRHLLEGTGINQGLFDSEEVLKIAQALSGSEIRIKQGEEEITGLALEAVARISPEFFTTYTRLPVQEALDFAIQNLPLDPELFNQDLLVIETCGWRLPDEGQVEGLENTSSSVYLGFVSLYDQGNNNN
ncbi:MAG: hypothetical protein SVP52_09165 [Chloroflexota bacterium]|nr:hypothetical protein [Chloroflexota bacterium]